MQQRPTGITILAVLSAIGGVVGILGGLSLVALGGALGVATGSAGLGTLGVVLGGVTLVLGVVSLALAYGFWTLQPWAWPVGVILELVSVGVTIAQLITGSASIFSAIIAIVIPGLILYYLNQPHIRKAFGR